MDILKLVRSERIWATQRGSNGLELVLIIYDTAGVERIYNREDMQWTAKNFPDDVIKVPAKYAVCLVGRDDSDMIAQYYARKKRGLEAEWTDDWDDIPQAIEKLKARNLDKSFPNEIAYVIDWPYRQGQPRPQKAKKKSGVA